MPSYGKLFALFFLFCQCQLTRTFNVLGVLPISSVSHTKTGQFILQGLAKKGHNVTVLSHYESNVNIKNYKEVLLEKPPVFMKEALDIGEVEFSSKFAALTRTLARLLWLESIICKQLESDIFKQLLSSNGKYDIVFIEFFSGDCMSVLADKFQARIVGYTSTCPMPWVTNSIGLPLDSSHNPNPFMGFTDRMSFFERVQNSLVNLWQVVFFKYVVRYKSDGFASKYYKNISPSEITKNRTDLILSNCHFSLNWPKTAVPALIDIAGVVPEKTTLPENLEKWISDSKHGVIYFSMGSLLKGHTLPKQKRDAFLKAFARLPQRVLWKWEEDMEDKPDNVMIQKWMPQFDILSHPNVKAFISHGGLLGTIEAVHCGVPMIVMPQFGDQHTNAKAVEANGGGIILYLSQATEESVYQALTTVLSTSFREQAKQLSQRFRDRPLPPLDTAIYWIEYVARYKGAAHMKTAAVNMPFYQYYLLDVFGFVFLVIFITIYVLYSLIRTVLRLFTKTTVKVKRS